MLSEQVATNVHLIHSGHGYISIPKRFIDILEWKDNEQLLLFLMEDDRIIITNKKPLIMDNSIKDFFKIKLTLVKVKTWHVGRISLKRDILESLGINRITLSISDNNIIIEKI